MPVKHLVILSVIILCLLSFSQLAVGQSKVKASADFTYIAPTSEDQYNQRIAHKTIPLSETEFILINRQTDTNYTIAKYNANLKMAWQATLPLASQGSPWLSTTCGS